MNDRELIITMLKKAGVVFKDNKEEIQIDVDDQDGDLRQGYIGFAAVLYFNQDGSLRTVGAWE